MRQLFIIIVVLCTIIGCTSEKDASDVVLLLDQSALKVTEGDAVRFGIETWTVHDRLERMDISSYDKENGKVDLVSVPLSSVRYEGEYFYRAPEIDSDSLVIELSFTVHDNLSNSRTMRAWLTIVAEDAVLDEAATSVLMYSPESGKPDGFSLTTLQPLYVSASEDSDVDIYVPAGQDSDVMSDGWLSKSGLKFARMDGIDYPTITRNRLWTLYSNAVKTDAVNGIAVGDVIMVGTDAVALGIILVTGVFDEEGTESDRYMFNIKLM